MDCFRTLASFDESRITGTAHEGYITYMKDIVNQIIYNIIKKIRSSGRGKL